MTEVSRRQCITSVGAIVNAYYPQVKPPPGSRFSARWLDSVAAFAAHQQAATKEGQQVGLAAHSSNAARSPTSELREAGVKTGAASSAEARLDPYCDNIDSSSPSQPACPLLDRDCSAAPSRSGPASDAVPAAPAVSSSPTSEMSALRLDEPQTGD